MNLLSHYVLAAKPKNPYYVLGCVFPDLIRMFHPDLRLIEERAAESDKTFVLDLEEGIDCHLDVDRQFHSSIIFARETDLIENVLRETKFDQLTRHYYFFAHILFEIFLDRFLLLDFPDVPNGFYNILGKLEGEAIGEYLDFRNYPAEAEQFPGYCLQFIEKEYLRKYREDAGLVHVFSSIHRRVFKVDVSREDRQRLDDCLEQIHLLLYPRYKEAFQEINPKVFKNFGQA